MFGDSSFTSVVYPQPAILDYLGKKKKTEQRKKERRRQLPGLCCGIVLLIIEIVLMKDTLTFPSSILFTLEEGLVSLKSSRSGFWFFSSPACVC